MASSPDPVEPDDRPRPVFARQYARVSPLMDEAGLAELRTELLAGLAGVVVEVGAGNGRNFGHYPPQVTRVDAVEPEPHLRALAARTAAGAPVLVETPGPREGIRQDLAYVRDAIADESVARARS